jgi:DNA-directed RNA polymerase subunit M/transcription elongation factor TFIIS
MPLTCWSITLSDHGWLDADEISGVHAVCPHCSNVLRISRANPSSHNPLGVHRFECRSCPYEYPLDKDYFEEVVMKQKEVEDVFGGKDEFKNADSIASELSAFDLVAWMSLMESFRLFQLSVLPKAVMETEPTSSNCKFAVLMNR